MSNVHLHSLFFPRVTFLCTTACFFSSFFNTKRKRLFLSLHFQFILTILCLMLTYWFVFIEKPKIWSKFQLLRHSWNFWKNWIKTCTLWAKWILNSEKHWSNFEFHLVRQNSVLRPISIVRQYFPIQTQ